MAPCRLLLIGEFANVVQEPNLRHYHPAVLVYASSVMGSDVATEKPDLESHSLIRFLDKFAYRNPKTKELTRGGSIMQPLQAGNSGSDTWLRSKSALVSGAPVNNPSFWSKKVENVAAEDTFFHEYFSHIGRTGEGSKRRAAPESEEAKEDQDEDEVWKALTAGNGDDEADMDDFDDAMADGDDSESDLPDWDSSSESDEAGEGDEDAEGAGADEGGDEDFVAVGSVFDDEAENDVGGGEVDNGKEKSDKRSKQKSRRQQLRELPMFASVDDYAELLAQEEEL